MLALLQHQHSHLVLCHAAVVGGMCPEALRFPPGVDMDGSRWQLQGSLVGVWLLTPTRLTACIASLTSQQLTNLSGWHNIPTSRSLIAKEMLRRCMLSTVLQALLDVQGVGYVTPEELMDAVKECFGMEADGQANSSTLGIELTDILELLSAQVRNNPVRTGACVNSSSQLLASAYTQQTVQSMASLVLGGIIGVVVADVGRQRVWWTDTHGAGL
jgi:hypothetical protein